MSLNEGGMTYSNIANYLNEKGIKTPRGKTWTCSHAHSVVKRYRQRQERIEEVRRKNYEPQLSKMELRWEKDF